MQLTLWRTHKHTHTHTHTHTHSLRSPPSTLHTLLVSRTLSTRINLRWLIKRLLKIRFVLGRMETNNAEPGSKHSIACEETDPVKMYKTDCKKGWRPRIQFVSRMLLILCILHRGSPAVWEWMAVNKCVKICTFPWPESLPHWASAWRSRQCNVAPARGATWHLHQRQDSSCLLSWQHGKSALRVNYDMLLHVEDIKNVQLQINEIHNHMNR